MVGKITVPKEMKINLFADEKAFPDLIKPVQMAWDTKGRLWVCAPGRIIPSAHPRERAATKLLILEDTKGTGVADKCTVFLRQ